jgi:hypothetical protein
MRMNVGINAMSMEKEGERKKKRREREKDNCVWEGVYQGGIMGGEALDDFPMGTNRLKRERVRSGFSH